LKLVILAFEHRHMRVTSMK